MAIISDVAAVGDFLGKATNFLTQFGDRWNQGIAELETFQGKVYILKAKQDHWSAQLKRFGMMKDESLKRLMEEADKILDKEVKNLSKKSFRKKAFPGKLTAIFEEVLKMVDAGPQLLASTVENHELLKKVRAQNPCRLPFDHDPKYVLLPELIKEVRIALEGEGRHRVVTVHAGPGMGKSSLVKYLGLFYRETKESMSFPDGVYYLFCGKGADLKVKQLQADLLESLGFGDDIDASSASAGQQGSGLKRKLQSNLVEQKLLIILDDVWEARVLKELLVPGQGLKYLVSSQNGEIWQDAEKIHLKHPSMDKSREVLANYTKGLTENGKLLESAKLWSVIDAIIRKLEHHPLSLATIGVSVNERRAAKLEEWEAISKRLLESFDYLENDLLNHPTVYEEEYPLTVGASMMVMVDSLPPDVQRTLFLVGLLEGPVVPEFVVKYLFKIMQSFQLISKSYDYNSCMDCLENRSLVEFGRRKSFLAAPLGAHFLIREHSKLSLKLSSFIRQKSKLSVLSIHGLRMHFIREKRTADVRSVAVQILGGHGNNDHDTQLIQNGDAEEVLLVAVLCVLYYSEPFRDVAAAKFKEQIGIFNHVHGFIWWNMGAEVDTLDDLVEEARLHKYILEDIFLLLNPDGDSGWKKVAQGCAKKIIIRFICRGELDDESTARLLQLPETTAVAFKLLYSVHNVDYDRPFLTTSSETMKALLALLHDDSAMTSRRAAAIRVLGRVLNYESEDDILSVGRKWTTLLGNDSCPPLHIAIAKALCDLSWRARLVLGELNPGVLEGLLMLLVKGKIKTSDRGELERAISKYSQVATAAVRIASFPGALETLFHIFLQSGRGSGGAGTVLVSLSSVLQSGWGSGGAGTILVSLSSVPENKTKFREAKDGLQGLVKLLLTSNSSKRGCREAATILGNLGLEKELRETVVGFSSILAERLRIYAESDSLSRAASRALTILYPVQPMALVLTAVPPSPSVCYEEYKGRAEGYRDMGLYAEALLDVDQAHVHLLQIPEARWKQDDLRELKWFLKAMVGDYADATMEATSKIKEYRKRKWPLHKALGHRGVLQRLSGNLAEALADFDEALELIKSLVEDNLLIFAELEYFFLLKNRGSVRHRMGDEAGAKADAESAQELKLHRLVWEKSEDAQGPRSLKDLPVSYLGFTF